MFRLPLAYGGEVTGALAQPTIVTPSVSARPVFMVGSLIASDAVALLISVGLAVLSKVLFEGSPGTPAFVRLWLFLLVFIAFYSAVGLYSGAALSPPEELRRATFSSAFLFPAISALTASWRGVSWHLTPTLVVALIASIVLVPLCRALVRQLLASKDWWGYPTVIFGAGETGRLVVDTLISEPGFGLKPVAVVDRSLNGPNLASAQKITLIRDYDSVANVVRNLRAPYAVVAMQGTDPESLITTIEEHIAPYFPRILVIPDLFRWSTLWIKPKSFGDILGLEVLQQTAMADRQLPKRVLDIVLSLVALILLAPILCGIAIAIKLESPGPSFFGHLRIGRNGRAFRAWKFRTMVTNSSEVLEQYLQENPEVRTEWERNQKLKNDPRVTRVGKLLRKTSLDEVPQLWNVLMSEMSLVGPRPIVEAEIPKYGSSYALYTRVKGGVTGLWQVSGRNNLCYEERVKLDSFYVRNWSVWLDLCILYKTIGTVLFRSGAY
jgi:Undecaprenyl-phosphate galactose phosphotransferase WbaP